MPEGPEIRLAADKIARVLVGQKIETVGFGLPQLKQYEKRLAGNVVSDVTTRGKAMLTRFDNGLNIYSHNQLYGRWYTVRRPKWPKTNRQLRIELHTKTHRALLYSASDIAVLDDDQLMQHPFLSRIGPDILDKKLTAADVVQRLGAPEYRNRALGNLYLEQRFLAGTGNYLRSEILWAAGIEPRRKPSSLRQKELEKLASETLRISRRSYRTRGVTVAPELATSLKSTGMTYREYRFYVFGRGGLPCHRCGSAIERRTMGSRNIFVCPGCQISQQGQVAKA
ncbi:MAG: endonuclease VIII [Gammaproteobacteria bacterium]|nr:endonuclease VIII [Gammaproteobacteria bacterium]